MHFLLMAFCLEQKKKNAFLTYLKFKLFSKTSSGSDVIQVITGKYFGLVIFTSSFTQSNKQNSLQENYLSLTIYSCSVKVLVKIGDFTSMRSHCGQRLYGKLPGSGLNRAAPSCTLHRWRLIGPL